MDVGRALRALCVTAVLLTLLATAREQSQSNPELEAAAKQGEPAAQRKFADAYLRFVEAGKSGSPRFHLREAEYWYRKGSARGAPDSQYGLARSLMLQVRTNEFIDGDWWRVRATPEPRRSYMVEEALAWYQLAAEQGFAPAQLELGRQYEAGTNVVRDTAESYKWFFLATKADATRAEAVKCLDALSSRLSVGDIAEGKRRAGNPVRGKVEEHPTPWPVRMLKLQGLGGTANRRVVIISGRTFEVGEDQWVRDADGTVVAAVVCLAIRDSSVRIRVKRVEGEYELGMVIPKVAPDTIGPGSR